MQSASQDVFSKMQNRPAKAISLMHEAILAKSVPGITNALKYVKTVTESASPAEKVTLLRDSYFFDGISDALIIDDIKATFLGLRITLDFMLVSHELNLLLLCHSTLLLNLFRVWEKHKRNAKIVYLIMLILSYFSTSPYACEVLVRDDCQLEIIHDTMLQCCADSFPGASAKAIATLQLLAVRLFHNLTANTSDIILLYMCRDLFYAFLQTAQQVTSAEAAILCFDSLTRFSAVPPIYESIQKHYLNDLLLAMKNTEGHRKSDGAHEIAA